MNYKIWFDFTNGNLVTEFKHKNRIGKEGLNFIENLDTQTINNSPMHLNNLYQSQTPYSNYLRYSNTGTSGPSWTNKHGNNLWKSVECSSKPSINEKSKRIANMKKTTNISVHDRLHQQALSKQKIEKREAQNNSFSIENRFDISELNPEEKKKRYKRRKGKSMNAPSRTSLNYGIRLYQKGIKQIEEIERKYKEALAVKEENELKDHTFQPKINPVSFYYGSKGYERPEEHLIKHGQMIKDKIDQKRAEIMYFNQKAWSFRPKINANSKNIVEQRSKFFEDDVVADEHSNNELAQKPDQFSHLYEDAMNRLERHNKIYSMWIDSECTFKPDIGKTRHKFAGHKYNQSKNIVSEKSLIEKYNSENFDPVTGQPLFHPKIGRSPRDKHHRSSKSIGNMLYNDNKIYQEKLEQIKREQENKMKNDMNSKYCKKTSEALLEKMKVKRFVTLFHILDSNGDGLVSAQKIDISQLKPELLEIMTPLFWEMEELGQTLDWGEFIDAWKLLYDTLNVCDKNKLLAISHKWEVERQGYIIDPSFAPEINKKSAKLAQYRRQDGERVEDCLVRK